jgi:cell division protein FtsB
VLVVAISLLTILGPGGYLELQRARRQLEAQRTRIEDLKRSNDERLRSIQALRSDREAIEKYARSKNYGKEGEIIQQLPEEPPSQK